MTQKHLMILLDYSQVAISNLHQLLKKESEQVEPDLLRHMILNSIRKANREFGKDYGQMVICTDNANYWRKSYFKYYKSTRKKDREDSGIDWALVFQTLHQLRDEIRETFPYKVMNVPMAEADDVIGIIVKHFHSDGKLLILSGDKDFLQLQIYPNVFQYAPTKDSYLKTDDPVRFLKEHIMRGDKGDGVPNFLSADDSFETGTRQKSILSAKVDVWVTQQPEEFCDETTLANYYRNQKLVDLSQIPLEVEAAVLSEYEKPIVGNRSKIYGYLVKHKMANLLSCIREF
jgi:hypothetical protein